MNRRDCRYTCRGCSHHGCRFAVSELCHFQLKQARNNLQAVLNPVIDFLEQDLMTVQCSLQSALVLLLLNCHTEDICGTLQEGDVMLAELTFSLTVDFKHSEWQAIAL